MTMGRQGRPYRGQPPNPGRPPVPSGPTPPRGRPLAGGSFTDRVMHKVAAEPTPSPGRVFLRSLRHLALRDALAALLAAWRLAFEPSRSVSPATRASAAGVFISVVLFVGVGSGMVAAGALALLGPDGQQQPPVPAASPSAAPVVTLAPSPSPVPSPTAEPTPSLEPSPSPTPTPSPTAKPTVKPTTKAGSDRATPKPTKKPQASSDDSKDDEREDAKKDESDEPDEKDEKDEKDD